MSMHRPLKKSQWCYQWNTYGELDKKDRDDWPKIFRMHLEAADMLYICEREISVEF